MSRQEIRCDSRQHGLFLAIKLTEVTEALINLTATITIADLALRIGI